jgi:hypothetical protein
MCWSYQLPGGVSDKLSGAVRLGVEPDIVANQQPMPRNTADRVLQKREELVIDGQQEVVRLLDFPHLPDLAQVATGQTSDNQRLRRQASEDFRQNRARAK